MFGRVTLSRLPKIDWSGVALGRRLTPYFAEAAAIGGDIERGDRVIGREGCGVDGEKRLRLSRAVTRKEPINAAHPRPFSRTIL
jgi:hypothetical protein